MWISMCAIILAARVAALLPQHHTITCSEKQFQCDSGACIPLQWKCDQEADCFDGSDESPRNCEKCGVFQFECEPRICIPETWVCDGEPDCINNFDEKNCTKSCRTDQFTCKSGECIAMFMMCDNDGDCLDGSDESNCTSLCKGSKDFQCPDNSCIPQSWRCDGDQDCIDGADERVCEYEPLHHSSLICSEHEFQCKDHINCINPSWVCDGDNDCLDGDDESPDMCSTVNCRSDQFKCKNRMCIPGFLMCDGHPDCTDNSDEENCTRNTFACKDNEFDCGHNICIPNSKVCDGKLDCLNGEDEPFGKCNLNECSTNNGGCSQVCIDSPTSYYCDCRPGYKLVNNYSCEDINECDYPESCSHKCINEKGTYKCECEAGYQRDPYDRTRCKPTEGHTQLIFTRTHDIRIMSVDHKYMTIVVNNTKASTALGFIYQTGTIFWSDSIEKKIYKAPIDKGNERTVVVSDDVTMCDGLAVDWIYNHIYWTDTGKDTIEVATLNGNMRKTLFSIELDEPRSLALNPLEGWMFWSDWGKQGKIERAGLDGTHRESIVTADIKWPNGLTLDFIRQRLYWVDAKLNVISSVNYDGSDRKTILKSSEAIHHPFSISVFEDVMYWTDWEKQTIFKANKFNGGNVTSLTAIRKLQNPMAVHVYHPYIQQNGTNYCVTSNTKCSHFCLPAPQINNNSPKITCACPDNLQLMQNGLTCSISENFTEPTPTSVKENPQINPQPSQPEVNNGHVVAIVVLSIALFIVLSSLVAIFVYQYFLKKNTTSANFYNPVYRKTTEDNVHITNIPAVTLN